MRKLVDYFLEIKKYIEELTSRLTCKSKDATITQPKKLIALSWLFDLDHEYEVVRS